MSLFGEHNGLFFKWCANNKPGVLVARATRYIYIYGAAAARRREETSCEPKTEALLDTDLWRRQNV